MRPVGRSDWIDRGVRPRLKCRRREPGPSAQDSPEDASDVRIDRTHGGPEGDRGDGTSRVWTDARQPLQRSEIARHLSVVLGDDHLRRAVEVQGTPVVAHPSPRPQDVRR